jgi:hypothetical protein
MYTPAARIKSFAFLYKTAKVAKGGRVENEEWKV